MLEQIIEEDKLNSNYFPYYYTWPIHILDGKMKLVRVGTVYKDEEDPIKKKFDTGEFLDTVILQEEKVLQKKKRWTDAFSKKEK